MEHSYGGSKVLSSASYNTTTTRLRSHLLEIDPSLEGKAVPLQIDKRWMMHIYNNSTILERGEHKINMLNKELLLYMFFVLQDSLRFYAYGIYEHA
jgi:hypothetical protein